jgi:hypothetical protein
MTFQLAATVGNCLDQLGEAVMDHYHLPFFEVERRTDLHAFSVKHRKPDHQFLTPSA